MVQVIASFVAVPRAPQNLNVPSTSSLAVSSSASFRRHATHHGASRIGTKVFDSTRWTKNGTRQQWQSSVQIQPEEVDPSDSNHSPKDNLPIEVRTMAWIQSVVIGLGLCPFAKGALDRQRLRVVVTSATSHDDLRRDIDAEIQRLCETDRTQIETTLIAAPEFVPYDFRRFHQFAEALETDIENNANLVDKVMVACFHPEHAWADADDDDPVNFDKRAPYPLFNLLRADQVDEYVAQGRTQDILDNNLHTLRQVGTEKLKELYQNLVT